MGRMAPAEVAELLGSSPARPGVLSTVRADGTPHAVPIWYAMDGESVVFNTGATTVKGRNLRRDGRATFTVHDDELPYAFVMVEGTVEISEELADVHRWATVIAERYAGPARAKELGDRNGVPGELLVRLTPVRITAFANLAD